MGFLYSVIGFLIAIGVLVAVHEFGHFWVARKLGVKVLRFSIGFGRPLWRKEFGQDQTEFVLAAIPLGGYVKMLGQGDPEVDIRDDELHRAFDTQAIWKRSLIVLAGPAINFLFAIILFFFLSIGEKEQLAPVLGEVPKTSQLAYSGVGSGDMLHSVDGKEVQYFGQHDLYIFNKILQGENFELGFSKSSGSIQQAEINVGDIPIYNLNPGLATGLLGLVPQYREVTRVVDVVLSGTPAEESGLQPGDEILAVDGFDVESWASLVTVISKSADKELLFKVRRNGSVLEIPITPQAQAGAEGAKVGRIGVGPKIKPYADQQIVDIDVSLPEALMIGVERTWLMSSVTLRMLWKMLTLQVSHKNISGPITIADYAGQAIQVSLSYYLSVLAIISISLGVMNLLPIPMLDGGHLLVYVVESVAGKNIAESFMSAGQRVGIFMLLCLMSLAFYNDIFRLLN